MSTPWVWPPLLACLGFALACGPKHPPAPDTPPSAVPTTKTTLYSVVGPATYRERIVMPPGAVFEATLEDVTRIDAPTVVIASIRIEQPSNVGIPFEIGYDRAMIVPSRRYAVRGRILVDGKPFFVTDQHYPVLTSGAGNQADLLFRKVSRQ